MRRTLLVVLLISLSLVSTVALAQSQATTGVIEGTGTDASGAALPGVTVIMKNTATNFEQTAITDRAGRFRGVLLPLGPYQVTATLEGFATYVAKGIDLGLGQTLTVPITLKQAAMSEQIDRKSVV